MGTLWPAGRVQFVTPPTCRDRTQDKALLLELPYLEISRNKKADSQVLQKKDDDWGLAVRRIIAQCSGWQPWSSHTILPLALKSWATSEWLLQQGGAEWNKQVLVAQMLPTCCCVLQTCMLFPPSPPPFKERQCFQTLPQGLPSSLPCIAFITWCFPGF